MKHFSDFAKDDKIMDGKKIKIENVLNKEIEITGYKITESQYKKDNNNSCLTLQFILNGEKHVLFTGSNVLIEQIEKYKQEMPFLAIIIKVDKFYTFS